MKILKSFFVLLFFISLANPISASTNLEFDGIEKFENSNLYNEYLSYLSQNDSSYLTAKSRNLEVEKDLIAVSNNHSNGFENVILIKNEIVNNTESRISYDTINNKYIFSELNLETDSFKFEMDMKIYELKYQQNRLVLLTNVGEVIPLIESSIYGLDLNSNLIEIYQEDNPIIRTRAAWIFKSGPYNRQTTIYISILDFISTVGGLYKYEAESLFGTIFVLLGVGSMVGQSLITTLNEKIYLFYRSDCTTYYKEEYTIYNLYSSSSNTWYETTGKYGIRYYHSVSPSITGQNCYAY